MKKILLLTTVFFLATSAVNMVDLTPFTGPDNFFTMEYPSHWQVTKNGNTEFIFKNQAEDLGKMVIIQEPTSTLASNYAAHQADLLDKFLGSSVKKLGYQEYVEYEKRESENGKEALRYCWVTGNDKYTVTIYYQVPFELRTKKEVLAEQKQVFKVIEGLKIQE